MKTVQPTVTELNGRVKGQIVQWKNVAEKDEPAAYNVVDFKYKSVQITGELLNGSISMTGANDPNDPVYCDLACLPHCFYIKPVVVPGKPIEVPVTKKEYKAKKNKDGTIKRRMLIKEKVVVPKMNVTITMLIYN